MNFTVIVRSIGERTESLCLQAIRREFSGPIYIIKNISPPYEVYLKNFQTLIESREKWGICIDADIILMKNWRKIIENNIENISSDQFFSITFNTQDYLSGKKLYRGIHIYNRLYAQLCYNFMCCNKEIIQTSIKNHILNKHFITKQESSLVSYFNLLGIQLYLSSDTIAYHAYEQYYHEFFRQYAVRAQRDKDNPSQLLEYRNNLQHLFTKTKNTDFKVGLLGIKHFDLFNHITDIQKLREEISLFLKNEYNILEKDPITLTLDKFYNIYSEGNLKKIFKLFT